MSTRHLILANMLIVLMGTQPVFAVNGTIGIFADQQALRCAALLPGQGQPLHLYVYAELFNTTRNGIQGAEYSITTWAATDWLFAEDFTPATGTGAIVLGSAMAGGLPGVNIAWPQCMAPVGGSSSWLLLLQHLTVVDFTGAFAGQWNRLRVEAHSTPGNPYFRCPLFNLCDDPVFTKVCAGWAEENVICPFPPGAPVCRSSVGGEFNINDIFCDGMCSCIQVEGKDWGSVKQLYR